MKRRGLIAADYIKDHFDMSNSFIAAELGRERGRGETRVEG